MKRSESILVYGVTGILVVILGVAVMFGGDAGGKQTPLGARVANAGDTGGTSLLDRAVDPSALELDAVDPAEDAARGGSTKPEGTPSDPAATPGPSGDDLRGEGVALDSRAPSLRVVLGPYEIVKQYDGSEFVKVTVRQGDTFSELVEKFTGSLANADEVRALNEQIDPGRLVAGQKILMPWVGEDELRAALQARREAPAASDLQPRSTPPLTAAPEEASSPRVPPLSEPAGTTGTVHVVKRGESLWKIAEGVVGRSRASAYVDEIVRANGIADASRVREGQKLTLPPAR